MTFTKAQDKADAAMKAIIDLMPSNYILHPTHFQMRQGQPHCIQASLDRFQIVSMDYREIAETPDLVPLLISRLILSHDNAMAELEANVEVLEKLQKNYQPKETTNAETN